MKSKLLLSTALFNFLLLVSIQQSYAQKFYFTAGGGYNFNITDIGNPNFCSGILTYANSPYYGGFSTLNPFAFNDINKSSSVTNYANGTTTYSISNQVLYQGFGGGFSFSVSAGYNFSQNISTELGFSYLLGTTLQSSISNNTTSYNLHDTTYDNLSISSQLKSSPRYRILPSVKISASPAKFTPYMKAGILVGFGGTVTVSNLYNETFTSIEDAIPTITPSSASTSLVASGNISFGFSGSAGVEYSLLDILSIYCEVNILGEKWYPSTGKITNYTESTPLNAALSTNTFAYSNNISTAGSNGYSLNNVLTVNSQYPQQRINFSSWGLALGIKLNLVKNKPATPPALQ